MSNLKTDIRQSISRQYHDELVKQQDHITASGEKKVNETQLDVLMTSVNSELTTPLRLMPSQPTPDLIVHVGPAIVTNSVSGKNKSIPLIGNVMPSFAGGTITLPATVGGIITNSNGNSITLTMAAGTYKKCIVSLGPDDLIYLNLGDDGATIATAPVPAPGIVSGIHSGYFVIQADGGGNILAVDHDNIFQFGSGAGGTGSGEGASRSPADGFDALVFDSFDVGPTLASSKIYDTRTNASYSASNQLYAMSCDKAPLITVVGTNFSLNLTPTFTIAAGDIIWVNSLNKFAMINSLIDQQNGMLDVAIGNVTGAAGMISQAVWTVDLVNYGDAAELVRLRDFYPAGNILKTHVEYADSLSVGDSVADFTQAARVVVAGSNEGLQSAVGYPTSNMFTAPFTRPISPSQWLDYPLGSNTNMQRAFFVFFPNPSNASVASNANLINYNISLYDKVVLQNGGFLNSAYCMSDSSGTPNECSNPTVVSGKTRVQLNWNYIPGINAGRVDSDIEVKIEGNVIPRWYSGVVGAYWQEVAGSTNLVELWTDLSIYSYSIHVTRRQGVIDSNNQNTVDIGNLTAALAVTNTKLQNTPPVGSIIAWMGGYFTGVNTGFTNVLANSVAAVNALLNSSGWYVCNGATINIPASPIFNGAGRRLPDLTDGRFLQGNTTAGGAGGQNSTTIASSNLPVHAHDMSHTHGTFNGSISGSTSSDGDHGHNLQRNAGPVGSLAYPFILSNNATPTETSNGGVSNAGTHSHSVSGSCSVTITAYNNSTGNGGFSNTALENRPKYLDVFYIMKVF